jgi:hypothetical protein
MISETKVMNGEFEALHHSPNISEMFEENFPSEKKCSLNKMQRTSN